MSQLLRALDIQKKRNPLPCSEFCLLVLYLSNKLSPHSVPENPMPPLSPLPPPTQAQVRAQEVGRVRDFPGGNVATSASRIAFLQRLCPLKKYLSLVDFVQTVVGAFFDYGYWLYLFDF